MDEESVRVRKRAKERRDLADSARDGQSRQELLDIAQELDGEADGIDSESRFAERDIGC